MLNLLMITSVIVEMRNVWFVEWKEHLITMNIIYIGTCSNLVF